MARLKDELRRELLAIYEDLERDLEALGPFCALSGACCRFEEYGHTLFATQLEVQHVLDGADGRPLPEFDEDHCPFYEAGRCSHRTHRPLGCRVFFCDPDYKDRMPEVHEAFFGRIKALHDEHGLPYEYGPFLRQLSLHRTGGVS